MKKTKLSILFLILPFITFTSAFAQSFNDGVNLISVGFGLPPGQKIKSDFDSNYKNYIDYKLKNYGTGVLKYEHGLSKYFGLGANFEYSGTSVSFKYDDANTLRYERQIRSNVFGFYARLNGHFPIGNKVDIYGGIGLGYLYTVDTYNDTNPNPGTNMQKKQTVLDFDYQATFGVRFMVKENMGLFFEAGWATTPVQVGMVFKF